MNDDNLYAQFAKYLRTQRKIHSLNQINIAKMADTSQRVISFLENGKSSHPSTRKAIEDAFEKIGAPSFSQWLKTVNME